jgi:hypothetical protein
MHLVIPAMDSAFISAVDSSKEDNTWSRPALWPVREAGFKTSKVTGKLWYGLLDAGW